MPAERVDPNDPVRSLPGIGPKRAEDLASRGAPRVIDLLRLFPREYILPAERCSIGDLREGETAVIDARLESVRAIRRGWRTAAVEGVLADGTGTARCLWFHAPYLARSLKPGSRLLVKGTIAGSPPKLLHPEFEVIREGEEREFERIVARYPSVPHLPPRALRRAIRHALERLGPLEDPLPADLRTRHALPAIGEALAAVHRPERIEDAARARRRFVFEELFRMQCAFAVSARARARMRTAHAALPDGPLAAAFLASLPFRLTADQEKAICEIRADLESGRPMERLLVGDVGSGKTVVAGAAIASVLGGGAQAALLVPTEVLARQHARVLAERFSPLGVEVGLLTGDLPAAERSRIRERLASGDLPVVVGTHALLEETTRFRDLALAVVDEQHRFGVRQRATLRGKGHAPHYLVMTATPIPRSLALTLYGDLDLSVIQGLPPGRRPIATRRLEGGAAIGAYRALREAVAAGEQGFVVFPLIEESESRDRKAAATAARKLADGFFRGRRVGLLHGRLPAAEKIDVVERLRSGAIDVLVATTVVEVGIDLARATVMIVENADRFGLSQLHQIRGRVGRSDLSSSCYLVTRGEITPAAEARLTAIVRESDGFRIAEEDLRLRGAGELLGERQHGPAGMGIADLLRDVDLIEVARREAFARASFDEAPGDLPTAIRSG
ncbi:MAG: ATP-dependent DNA helicase RecG [Candidatus Latescibacterota bacterium]|nr:MAG: ATP-dependent DNA helicase RecG [Candidatus Latescibacterota bacterium]